MSKKSVIILFALIIALCLIIIIAAIYQIFTNKVYCPNVEFVVDKKTLRIKGYKIEFIEYANEELKNFDVLSIYNKTTSSMDLGNDLYKEIHQRANYFIKLSERVSATDRTELITALSENNNIYHVENKLVSKIKANAGIR